MSDPKPAPVVTPEAVEEFRSTQQHEYAQYVALQPISYNSALAYLPGDPVPASNVERHKYAENGLVAKVGSAPAQKLIASIHEAITTEPSEVAAPVSLNAQIKS